MGLCRRDKRARCSLFNILVVKQQHQLQETPVQWDGFIFLKCRTQIPVVYWVDPTCLHPAESDRLNMASVMEFGETVRVCRDTPGVLQLHSAFLYMYKDSLSCTTGWAHICKKGVVYTVRIFPFFLFNGLVHFFSACQWIRADRRLCQGGNSRDFCWEMIALHCYSY